MHFLCGYHSAYRDGPSSIGGQRLVSSWRVCFRQMGSPFLPDFLMARQISGRRLLVSCHRSAACSFVWNVLPHLLFSGLLAGSAEHNNVNGFLKIFTPFFTSINTFFCFSMASVIFLVIPMHFCISSSSSWPLRIAFIFWSSVDRAVHVQLFLRRTPGLVTRHVRRCCWVPLIWSWKDSLWGK